MRFANHSDNVAFGDINLSQEGIRGAPHDPGAGGWPTIRYFNKETGVDGASYVKKTSKTMCDELGDNSAMEKYVLEAAKIVLCDVATGKGCNDRELKFVESWSVKTPEQRAAEIVRLSAMKSGDAKLKATVIMWAEDRITLLTAMGAAETVRKDL